MNRKPVVWLATVGLNRKHGGVAGVARACLSALLSNPEVKLTRVISLLDHSRDGLSIADSNICFKSCGGNRVEFLLEVLKQSVVLPDLIIYDHVDIAQCQVMLPWKMRRPYCLWGHGIEVWKPLPRTKVMALKSADRLLFNSKFTESKFRIHHNFIRSSRVVPLSSELDRIETSFAHREPWILTVGRLEPDRPKGHSEILNVLSSIVNRIPNVRWQVVGTGSSASQFRKQVIEQGCGDNVVIHGFITDEQLTELYNKCRVFAMPSHGEGFGIVYIEAMKFGCVPVGSTKDAAQEVIGEGGFCVPLDDLNQLYNTIVELLTIDDDHYEDLSLKAKRRSEEYSKERFKKRFIEAILR